MMVRPAQVHEDAVKEDGDHGEGQDADHLRGAVGAALQQGPGPPLGPDHIEGQVPADAEEDRSHQGGECVADAGGDGRPREPLAEDRHEKPVQHDVQHSADDGEGRPQPRPAHGDEAQLEHHAEDGEGDGD